MSTPLPKSPELTKFLEKLFGQPTGEHNTVCVICRAPAVDFRDDVTRREFQLSGLCQPCQDIIFEPGEPIPAEPDPEPVVPPDPYAAIRRDRVRRA